MAPIHATFDVTATHLLMHRDYFKLIYFSLIMKHAIMRMDIAIKSVL